MKTLIKCDKCGSLNVDEMEVPRPPPEPVKPTILTMDQYIERNKSTSSFIYSSSTMCVGTSRMRRMKLHCFDCGHEKEWEQIQYI